MAEKVDSEENPMDNPEIRNRMAELTARLEAADSPQERAAVLESTAGESGTDIDIIMTPEGDTIGWRDKKTGALFVSDENLRWPAAMPSIVPVFDAVAPNGITVDPSGCVAVFFPPVGRGPVEEYLESIQTFGWAEDHRFEDESQIVYEGKQKEAILSVIWAGGSLVITFTI